MSVFDDEILMAQGKQRAFVPISEMVKKEDVPGGDPSRLATLSELENIARFMGYISSGLSGDMVFRAVPGAGEDGDVAEIDAQNDSEAQVLTATIVGAVASDGVGNLKVTVTARGMNDSPKEVTVAVANSDDQDDIAGKIRTALAADTDISDSGSAFFTVTGLTDQVILTANLVAPPDFDMAIAIDVNDVGEATGSDIGTTYEIDPLGKAYTRYVQIFLETAEGDPHMWYSGDVAVTIANTAGAGTAHLLESTLKMHAGHAQATVYLSGTWAAEDTNTLSVTEATILGHTVAAVTSVETSEDNSE